MAVSFSFPANVIICLTDACTYMPREGGERERRGRCGTFSENSDAFAFSCSLRPLSSSSQKSESTPLEAETEATYGGLRYLESRCTSIAIVTG
jgi:hypothetical protein